MAKYRKIDPRIWNDAKFTSLSNYGKLLFMFLLTHPHMTSLGAMRASAPGLAAELGWQEKAFQEAFQEVCSKGMAKHDSKASLVWLPKFIRYNKPESPNVLKAWGGAIDMIPECPMKNELLQSVKDFTEDLPEAFIKALPEAFSKPMLNPEQEQEPEQEPEQEVKDYPPASHPEQPEKSKTYKPEIEEVFDYWCQTMGKNSLTKLTKDRKDKIKARLNEGYNINHIKQAIDGCARSPHHMGKNDAGTVYDDLTLICRTGSKLEWFAKSVGSKEPVDKNGPETINDFAERNRRQAERVMASGMLDDLPPERG